MGRYFVGVDLGQARDFTAIAVVERAEVIGEWDAAMWAWRKEIRLRLRFLERASLGTPYPEVVDRVVQVTRSRNLAGRCHLAVDGTPDIYDPTLNPLYRDVLAHYGAVALPCRVRDPDRKSVV